MGKLTHTVKGPIASFRSADKAPIESLKLHFLPKQEGSGDASPQNIRNILGWTGCNLFKAKKNLFDNNNDNIEYGYIKSADGSIVYSESGKYTVYYTKVKPNTTYALKGTGNTGILTSIAGYDINKNYISRLGQQYNVSSSPLVFSTPSNCYYIRFSLPIDFSNYQLEEGSASTQFEAYEGSTIPLSWSDHGVEYGGYVDPVRGKLVAEYEFMTDTWGNWGTAQDQGDGTVLCVKRFTNPVYGNSINNHHTDYCNVTKYVYANENGNPHYYIVGNSYNCRVYLPNDFPTDQVIQVIGKLITPIEYDLTPTEMQTFLDYNNFWSDMNGDTEVEYCFADRLSERKLIMDTPHIATASGTVASFNTDLKAHLKELKVHFTPVQEGTGDASPQNIRNITGWTGCNVEIINGIAPDISNYVGMEFVNGRWQNTQTDSRTKFYAYVQLFKNGTYIKNAANKTIGEIGVNSLTFSVDDSNCNQIVFLHSGSSNNMSVKFSFGLPLGTYTLSFNVVSYDPSVVGGLAIKDIFLIPGNSVARNEIPITFPATKNLFDTAKYGRKDGYSGLTVSEGSYSFAQVNGGNSCIIWGSQTFPAGTYTLNAKVSGDGTNGFRLLCSSSSCGGTYNSYYGGYFINSSDNNSKITFTTTESFAIGICLLSNLQHERESGMIYDIQLELGLTATPYEPYGNVYGGYIDLIRGKIVATHGIYKTKFGPSNPSGVLGDYERHGYNMNVLFKAAIDLHANGQGPYDLKKTFCNVAFWNWNYFGDYLHYYIDGYQAYIMLPVGTDPDTEIEFCAELATPIEYDLTPETLKSLKGQNNIFADTNGNVDVKYWTH